MNMEKQIATSQFDFKQRRPYDVISASLPADLETPVSVFLKLKKHGAKFLLESVDGGTIIGRYSFIGIKPESKIIIDNKYIYVQNGSSDTSVRIDHCRAPLDLLRKYLNQFQLKNALAYPRLLGGMVGYIGYDFVRFLEKLPHTNPDDLNLPLAIFHMIDTLLIFDHVARRIKILRLTDDISSKKDNEILRSIKDILLSPLKLPATRVCLEKNTSIISNFTKDRFCKAVNDVKEHIKAGDVYQQVISQRVQLITEADPFTVYRCLRMINPSPYMYYLDFDDFKLIGSSPEAMVRLENNLATIRPIAGSRPRGENEEQDHALAADLIADEKERAEHVMLVDLGRNDLGRCCKIGSVKVTEFMKIERFSHIMHLTSNITGKLRPGLDQFELFAATFPAGTLTGAPKIRAMELIDEIENTKRGPYGGAVGYFSLTGDTDWCINIRTIIMKGKTCHLQAGAGIVADSIPEHEYIETNNKIAALKAAIESAERGLV
jgi:anthranilate synthase component 1